MIFGPDVEPAPSPAPARWILTAAIGGLDTVGDLVPRDFDHVLLVHAPEPSDRWWVDHRGLVATISAVAAHHTDTPGECWYGVWEGHGFTSWSSRIAVRRPLDSRAERELAAERDRLRVDDARRQAEITAALAPIPRVERPHRTYYLLHGPIAAAMTLVHPGPVASWHPPDLWWPDDRSWFVATDVDLWSFYVGGDRAFLDAITAAVPTPTEDVDHDTALVIED